MSEYETADAMNSYADQNDSMDHTSEEDHNSESHQTDADSTENEPTTDGN